jgi:hypothetical protein
VHEVDPPVFGRGELSGTFVFLIFQSCKPDPTAYRFSVESESTMHIVRSPHQSLWLIFLSGCQIPANGRRTADLQGLIKSCCYEQDAFAMLRRSYANCDSRYTIILNHPRGWGGKPTGSHRDSRVAEISFTRFGSPAFFVPAAPERCTGEELAETKARLKRTACNPCF